MILDTSFMVGMTNILLNDLITLYKFYNKNKFIATVF